MADLPKLRAHAIDRYIERVRPGLSFAAAREELLVKLRSADRCYDRPPWMERASAADYWLTVSDWLAAPVQGGWVVTVVVRDQVHAQIEWPTEPERSTAA